MKFPREARGGCGTIFVGGCFGPRPAPFPAFFQQVRAGQISQEAPGKPVAYMTSGGNKVIIDGDNLTITGSSGIIQQKRWSDLDEHREEDSAADWIDEFRVLILDDGTRIRMFPDESAKIGSTTIFDGGQAIQINNKKNEISNVTFDLLQTGLEEDFRPDGATSYIGFGWKGDYILHSLCDQNPELSIHNGFRMLASSENEFWLQELPVDQLEEIEEFR